MADQTYQAELIDSLDRDIVALKAQGVHEFLTAVNAPAFGEEWGALARQEPIPSPKPKAERTPEEQAKAELDSKLEARLEYLSYLRRGLEGDPELLHFVDSVIGNHVRDAEQRQRTRSIVLTISSSVASLIAGWLLSAISPASALAHLFVH